MSYKLQDSFGKLHSLPFSKIHLPFVSFTVLENEDIGQGGLGGVCKHAKILWQSHKIPEILSKINDKDCLERCNNFGSKLYALKRGWRDGELVGVNCICYGKKTTEETCKGKYEPRYNLYRIVDAEKEVSSNSSNSGKVLVSTVHTYPITPHTRIPRL